MVYTYEKKVTLTPQEIYGVLSWVKGDLYSVLVNLLRNSRKLIIGFRIPVKNDIYLDIYGGLSRCTGEFVGHDDTTTPEARFILEDVNECPYYENVRNALLN